MYSFNTLYISWLVFLTTQSYMWLQMWTLVFQVVGRLRELLCVRSWGDFVNSCVSDRGATSWTLACQIVGRLRELLRVRSWGDFVNSCVSGRGATSWTLACQGGATSWTLVSGRGATSWTLVSGRGATSWTLVSGRGATSWTLVSGRGATSWTLVCQVMGRLRELLRFRSWGDFVNSCVSGRGATSCWTWFPAVCSTAWDETRRWDPVCLVTSWRWAQRFSIGSLTRSVTLTECVCVSLSLCVCVFPRLDASGSQLWFWC